MLPFPRSSLIVSCQPVAGGPLDQTGVVVAFALAAVAGGARALRIEGVERVRAVVEVIEVPVIGLVKRDLPGTPVRITPYVEDAEALAKAGARIIAYDATSRPHPVAPRMICAAIQAAGKLAMADISSTEEAKAAAGDGADIVATTLSGHTGGPIPQEPDIALIAKLQGLGLPVIAEGRMRTPEQAREALAAGAYAVVVGSAITRPEHITGWFAEAMAEARPSARQTRKDG